MTLAVANTGQSIESIGWVEPDTTQIGNAGCFYRPI